jgi:hypothetical protein
MASVNPAEGGAMNASFPKTRIKRVLAITVALAICGLAILKLVPSDHASAQENTGITVIVKQGHLDSLYADGKDQTVLIVDIDPTASCWTPSWWIEPVSTEGQFWIWTSTSLGSVNPPAGMVPGFPTELTLTAGTTPGQAQVTVEASYCPPGAVMLFGECSVMIEYDADGDGFAESFLSWTDEHPVCTAQVTIEFEEAPFVGDRDDDGVPDDEDLCPDEAGEEPDGCPDFDVRLGCQPPAPAPGEQVACTVEVIGAHEGETFEYRWYLDYAFVEATDGPAWTWGTAEEGTHDIGVQVTGEGRVDEADLTLEVGEEEKEKEEAEDTHDLEAPIAVPEVVDDPQAGFHIAFLSCSDGISSDETLACSAGFEREQAGIGALSVVWLIDGAAAGTESAAGNSASWALDQPAPGDHVIEVRVIDPQTGRARVASTWAQVRPGRNALVPPIAQLGAAGGTLAVVGAWLWLEWLRGRQAAVEEVEEREVPSWVFDRRSLREIWAEEAGEEARRRGLEDHLYSPEDGRFYTPDWIDARLQERLRDEYWKLRDTLAENPNLGELADFVDANFDNVFRDGRWDAEQMARLQKAVTRLGGMELGVSMAEDYTYRDMAIDTLGQASQNFVVRAGAAALSFGASEIALQPTSTIYTMRKKVLEGGMRTDQAAWEAYVETGIYAGSTLLGGVAAKGFAVSAPELARDLSPLARRAGDAIAKAMPSVAKAARSAMRAGARVREIANMPVGEAWQRFGDWRRLGQLQRANPRLAQLVREVHGQVKGGNLGMRQSPTLAFTDPAKQNLCALTDQQFALTPNERAAARILEMAPREYEQAVRQGLIPRRVHQLVNHTRDKIAKHAMVRAYRSMRPELRSGFRQVQITGTGARPSSPPATSGYTDLDTTALGTEEAQRTFTARFYRELRRGGNGMPGLNPRRVDTNMFPGLRPETSPHSAGYGSRAMVEWQRADASYRGLAVTKTNKGNLVFGQHPDAALRPGQAPYRFNPRALGPEDIAAGRADCRRLITHHIEQLPADRLSILRSEGKHAGRFWWVENVGQGQPRPEWIRTLDKMKADRTSVPSADELDEAWRGFCQMFGLDPGGVP